eukprot:TRINITY_DN7196_c0_g1_i1.p1 TRINITY_DN7196_c0_g1~~TRINITY_DN7196_c0_g1_i1.p1  ORF type:complete len:235 (-),score=24.65 TRINITY_DN7196_c0_g1_i1:289-993(-)
MFFSRLCGNRKCTGVSEKVKGISSLCGSKSRSPSKEPEQSPTHSKQGKGAHSGHDRGCDMTSFTITDDFNSSTAEEPQQLTAWLPLSVDGGSFQVHRVWLTDEGLLCWSPVDTDGSARRSSIEVQSIISVFQATEGFRIVTRSDTHIRFNSSSEASKEWFEALSVCVEQTRTKSESISDWISQVEKTSEVYTQSELARLQALGTPVGTPRGVHESPQLVSHVPAGPLMTARITI